MLKNKESKANFICNTFKYYRYKGYSYRIEFSAGNIATGASMLQSNGIWVRIAFGWERIIRRNIPISEAEAFLFTEAEFK
jgi:hypothetical protein